MTERRGSVPLQGLTLPELELEYSALISVCNSQTSLPLGSHPIIPQVDQGRNPEQVSEVVGFQPLTAPTVPPCSPA